MDAHLIIFAALLGAEDIALRLLNLLDRSISSPVRTAAQPGHALDPDPAGGWLLPAAGVPAAPDGLTLFDAEGQSLATLAIIGEMPCLGLYDREGMASITLGVEQSSQLILSGGYGRACVYFRIEENGRTDFSIRNAAPDSEDQPATPW